MKNTLMHTCVAIAASLAAAAAAPQIPAGQDSVAAVTPAAPAGALSELETLTRSCSAAALNAAARRAASAPSQGKYQFSFFNLISDSHHAQYEVHFSSNYEGEPMLKYCVEIYCQQGWDPKNVKAAVTEMRSSVRKRGAAPPHRGGCGPSHARGK